ncbi:UNVERIFIED_CONTAM: hypothetical protein B566_EDAN018653, partial [Ephemera danica]
MADTNLDRKKIIEILDKDDDSEDSELDDDPDCSEYEDHCSTASEQDDEQFDDTSSEHETNQPAEGRHMIRLFASDESDSDYPYSDLEHDVQMNTREVEHSTTDDTNRPSLSRSIDVFPEVRHSPQLLQDPLLQQQPDRMMLQEVFPPTSHDNELHINGDSFNEIEHVRRRLDFENMTAEVSTSSSANSTAPGVVTDMQSGRDVGNQREDCQQAQRGGTSTIPRVLDITATCSPVTTSSSVRVSTAPRDRVPAAPRAGFTATLRRGSMSTAPRGRSSTAPRGQFGPNRQRPEGSSLFGFRNDSTLVSYVPKPGRAVILLSTFHHNDNIIESTNKPEIIHFYNETKGGVDTLDHLIQKYSCKRATRRWPMIMFYNLIDIICVAAFVIWRATYPAWNYNKKYRRRLFLESVGLALVEKQIDRRYETCHHNSVRSAIRQVQPERQLPNHRGAFRFLFWRMGLSLPMMSSSRRPPWPTPDVAAEINPSLKYTCGPKAIKRHQRIMPIIYRGCLHEDSTPAMVGLFGHSRDASRASVEGSMMSTPICGFLSSSRYSTPAMVGLFASRAGVEGSMSTSICEFSSSSICRYSTPSIVNSLPRI